MYHLPFWGALSRGGLPPRKEAIGSAPSEGLQKNLLWVVDATYCGSQVKPTVGFFDDLPWIVFEAQRTRGCERAEEKKCHHLSGTSRGWCPDRLVLAIP